MLDLEINMIFRDQGFCNLLDGLESLNYAKDNI